MKASSDAYGCYVVSPLTLFERFLFLGSMSCSWAPTKSFAEFSVADREAVYTIALKFPEECLSILQEIVLQKRAPKNPPLLLALACLLQIGLTRDRAEALSPQLVRTATDQFVLTQLLLQLREGKGRSFKRFASSLYRRMDSTEPGSRDALALQFVKYRNRAGWTHRDLLRVSHFSPSELNNDLFKWAAGKGPATHPTLEGFEKAQKVTSADEAVEVLHQYPTLPWEGLPSEFLNSAQVWEALLPRLGDTALLRNLGRMQSYGIDLSGMVERIKQAAERQHPVASLSAWKVYLSGSGILGSLKWIPDPEVARALNEGFNNSFTYLRKSNAKVMFGIDVSGSMHLTPSMVPGLTCREAAAVMVKVAAQQQPYRILCFSYTLREVEISHTSSIQEVVRTFSRLNFGNTNAGKLVRYAIENKIDDVDVFAIFTDNEVNTGVPPSALLTQYRKMFNPNAKMVSVAFAGGGKSIADPSDIGMIDFNGFDASVPGMLVDFAEKPLF